MAARLAKTLQQKIIVIFILFSSSAILTVTYIYPTATINYNTYITLNRSPKYILYWNDMFGWKEMGLGLGKDIFKKCPINSCLTTYDRNLMPVDQYDAIVFHAPTFWSWFGPKSRNVHQKYIYYNKESPITKPDSVFNKHFYNWTMTYRRDSDIYSPYGLVQKQKTNYKKLSLEKFNKKKKMAAWFVSSCGTPARKKRENYVTELKKYVQVDIYGECGDLKCDTKDRAACYNMLEDNYKFYLSFENSMCLDYVTEKLYNILSYDIVPIVLGSADYNNLAPPQSFINTNDFNSPEALAAYLLQVSDNIKQYTEYFEWKKDYVIIDSKEYTLCQICKKLHEPLNYSSYEDINEWAIGTNAAICYV